MVNKKTWSPQPQALKPPPYTVEASGFTAIEGETIPRRNVLAKYALNLQPEEGVATIYDILKRSSRKFGNAKAMGSRKLLKTHTEIKKIQKTVDGKYQTVDKKWTYSELSEYQYVSFIEFEQMAIQIGAGLRQLGMNKDDRIEIFGATTAHWLAIAHGNFRDARW
jgi:long-chain acyl-CoA synthetase